MRWYGDKLSMRKYCDREMIQSQRSQLQKVAFQSKITVMKKED